MPPGLMHQGWLSLSGPGRRADGPKTWRTLRGQARDVQRQWSGCLSPEERLCSFALFDRFRNCVLARRLCVVVRILFPVVLRVVIRVPLEVAPVHHAADDPRVGLGELLEGLPGRVPAGGIR